MWLRLRLAVPYTSLTSSLVVAATICTVVAHILSVLLDGGVDDGRASIGWPEFTTAHRDWMDACNATYNNVPRCGRKLADMITPAAVDAKPPLGDDRRPTLDGNTIAQFSNAVLLMIGCWFMRRFVRIVDDRERAKTPSVVVERQAQRPQFQRLLQLLPLPQIVETAVGVEYRTAQDVQFPPQQRIVHIQAMTTEEDDDDDEFYPTIDGVPMRQLDTIREVENEEDNTPIVSAVPAAKRRREHGAGDAQTTVANNEASTQTGSRSNESTIDLDNLSADDDFAQSTPTHAPADLALLPATGTNHADTVGSTDSPEATHDQRSASTSPSSAAIDTELSQILGALATLHLCADCRTKTSVNDGDSPIAYLTQTNKRPLAMQSGEVQRTVATRARQLRDAVSDDGQCSLCGLLIWP